MFSKKMKQVNKAHVITSSMWSGVIQVIEVRDAPPFSSSNLTPQFGYRSDTDTRTPFLNIIIIITTVIIVVVEDVYGYVRVR